MFGPFLLSLRLAAVSAPLTVLISLPAAILLSFRRFRGSFALEVLFLTPLVLPPTVLGFYLLIFFSRLGGFLSFQFSGLVVAGIVVAFPLVVQNLKNGMSMVPRETLEASTLLGKSCLETFARILLPQIKGNILAALALSFAKITGEFGVMMMVGGNIAGSTRLASLALYERVEALDYAAAHAYALLLAAANIGMLAVFLWITRGSRNAAYRA
ncbi:ABC transporter permease subunit [Marispirochaeta sp.]|jgi:molybdate transport system permease protein|uniref:molybdate ABC transporter permease subunit n=1 Tax=Marispirochaeta sp. TaxID=2038653 RepID=UPI0029C6D4C5|nr:ABC transporter permease subunit [Marispirochaeta sp.]